MVGRSDKEVCADMETILRVSRPCGGLRISPYGLPAVSGALSAPCTTSTDSVEVAAPPSFADCQAVHIMVRCMTSHSTEQALGECTSHQMPLLFWLCSCGWQAADLLRRCDKNPKTGKTRGKCSPIEAYIVSGSHQKVSDATWHSDILVGPRLHEPLDHCGLHDIRLSHPLGVLSSCVLTTVLR